jgi:threonine dehydrogenase-like Zn-dependent dehydrogenase
VAVEIPVPCRHCDRCLAGRYLACRRPHASHGYTSASQAPGLWGGFAEYMYLHPNSILHRVRPDIPAEVAVMFNPLGAGVRWAVHLGGTRVGDTVLILGSGQRGISAVIAARAAGAGTIIVTGLGRDALSAAAQEGRVVLAGLKGTGTRVEIGTDVIVDKAITVTGAFGVDSRAYAEAIRIIESGRLPLERMHTHDFGLDDLEQAIRTLAGEVPGEDALHVAIRPLLASPG